MAHASKTRASGLSASSHFDLQATISALSAERRRTGKRVGMPKEPKKGGQKWIRSNPGVQARAARDIELDSIDKRTHEYNVTRLEHKAKQYDQLLRGKTAGMTEGEYENQLVDFESKERLHSDQESENASESDDTNSQADPMEEYVDELGRTRTARRSEIPRNLRPPEEDPDEASIIYNPTNYFPTYEPSLDRRVEIEKNFADTQNPLSQHFDASRENRAKGAAFFAFSRDEETRKREMEELANARKETQEARQESGAVNVMPGEVEGMRAETRAPMTAGEKRKRKLEERRQLVAAAKKQKRQPEPDSRPRPDTPPPRPSPTATPFGHDPFAAVESRSHTSSYPTSPPPNPPTSSSTSTAADDFLASLERDILRR
ncbi:hypothetical protein DL96DRAFT_1589766 [Flagelloscypha sp. PMI_526]|nr:hypothetical protein DL96DRAFT_1589766 [Flagelloscypha sp. PMI_526]